MKRRFFKSILALLLIFLVTSCVFDFAAYSINNINNRNFYLNKNQTVNDIKNIQLVGLIDSMGVPYTNDKNIGFFEMLIDRLDLDNQSISMYNLYLNKTWHVEGIFQNNISINEFRLMQNFSIDFNKLKFPNYIKGNIHFPDSEFDYIISDRYTGFSNPVVVYSCGVNDLFYYFDFNPANISFEKLVSLLKDGKKSVENMVINVEKNIQTIISLNSNSKILILGIYNPFENYFLNRLITPYISTVNKGYRRVAEEFDNVEYLDTSFLSSYINTDDFHPSDLGQQRLYYEVYKSLQNLVEQDSLDISRNEVSIDASIKADAFNDNYIDKLAVSKEICNAIQDVNLANDNLDYVRYSVIIEEVLSENNVAPSFDQINSISENVLKLLSKESINT